jgi:alpha-1,2-mannosyltransferase
MYTTMLGSSAFMDWTRGIKTARGIFWFALGSLLGWPFAGALILPFILEEIVQAVLKGDELPCFKRLLNGTGRALFVLASQVALDSLFYRKFVCVPLNIVLYNVFSGGSKGPNIYGVEPWHFYIRNLLLNFNVWFILALGAIPLLLLQHIFGGRSISRGVTFASPFYLWLGIFTLQPHKEERFMYPAYPALALNAAISLHILLANFGSTDPRNVFSKIPAQLKLAVICTFILGALDFGALRVIGTMTAYSAPLEVYKPLQRPGVASHGDFVCLGKEWYRFPSTYFLPEGVKAKFIKSQFSGLLPGEFSEGTAGFGSFPGAWMVPPGMNDENREDPHKYTDIGQCKFLVDSYFPGNPPSALEPNYISDKETWETLSCKPFLDAGHTSIFGRLLWIPDWPFIPPAYRRKWGQYCLLRQRRNRSGKIVQKH